MLIACRFKRPNAPVQLPNADGTLKTYFFRPVAPNSPDSEHVAEVTDRAHIERLLAIPEGYYLAEAENAIRAAELAAKGGTKPEATVTPPPAASAPAAPADVLVVDAPPPPVTPPSTTPPEQLAAAVEALLELKPKAFREALDDTPTEVLQEALRVEQAKGDDERVTFTKAMQAALTARASS